MKRKTYVHSLALRYGLVGAAASHHLLLSANDEEELLLIESFTNWPYAVEEHVRWDVMSRLPIEQSPSLPTDLAQQAYQPIISYLDMYRRLCPLEDCLQAAVQNYLAENIDEIRSGWNWLLRGKPLKQFNALAQQSIHYALAFFERRQAGLDEVPVIALLGE